MSPSEARVVITGSGTVTCQSVIKGLRGQSELPVEIITVDASDEVAGRYFSDAFYRVPNADDPRYVDAMFEICARHQANLLIPIVDYEFKPLSGAIDRFASIGCLVAISPQDVVKRVNDKLETYRFFLENNFPTPKTWSATEARREIESLPYPVFLKPALDGRSSIDCYRVEDASDLALYLDKVENAMVQEFIEGPEFTADILADWESNALGVVVRQRIETKGGVSYKGRTIDDPELTAQVVRMAKCLGIRGPANIQAFRQTNADGASALFFNEINPRFSGALALTLAAGLNSPLLLAKLALGLPVESLVGQSRVGVTMLRFWMRCSSVPMAGPSSRTMRLSPAAKGWPSLDLLDHAAPAVLTDVFREATAGKRLLVLDYDGTLAYLAIDWSSVRRELARVASGHGFKSDFRPLWGEIARFRDTHGMSAVQSLFRALAQHEEIGVDGQTPRDEIIAGVRTVMRESKLRGGDSVPQSPSDGRNRSPSDGHQHRFRHCRSRRCGPLETRSPGA